ncbi:hypothetical protein RS9916_30424 [Synechococcus sp. RS9916]|nr:hypothetical protein RS9916_30424 [Synechococcus sp. RS9916]
MPLDAASCSLRQLLQLLLQPLTLLVVITADGHVREFLDQGDVPIRVAGIAISASGLIKADQMMLLMADKGLSPSLKTDAQC